MCNNKCARVNATYKFQTYKAITLFQAKLLLHNHIYPPRSIRICSLHLPRALESPTATTCRIPQLQVSSETKTRHTDEQVVKTCQHQYRSRLTAFADTHYSI